MKVSARIALVTTILLGSVSAGMPLHAQVQGVVPPGLSESFAAPQWTVVDDTMRGATDLEISPDGGRLYVASLSKVITRDSNMGAPTLSMYNARTGVLRWRFSTRHLVRGATPQIALSPDGQRIYMNSTINHGTLSTGSPDPDIATWALNAKTGANMWYQRYNGFSKLYDEGRDILASNDLVVATGSTYRSGGRDYELWLRAFGPRNGRIRWTRIYSSGKRADPNGDEHAHEKGVALAFANGGKRVVVTGETGKPAYAILTLDVDSATGAVKWVGRGRHPAGRDGIHSGLDVAVAGGRAFVAGYGSRFWGDEHVPITLAHRTRNGDRSWLDVYEPGDPTFGQAVAVTIDPSDAAPIFAGHLSYREQNQTRAPYRIWSQHPETGNMRFVSEDVTEGFALDVAMAPEGGLVYSAGQRTTPEGQGEPVLYAFDAASGAARWAGRAEPGARSGFGLVHVTETRAFAGGSVHLGPNQDVLLLAGFARD